MAKTIRIKRGLDQDRQNYVPSLGELVWTTDKNELWVGDGQTAGGIKVTQKVEDNYIPEPEKGTPGGVATLDFNGKLTREQVPAVAVTESYVVNSENEQLALPAQEGDVAIRIDINKNYINNGGTTGTMQDWTELVIPPDSITSVNGKQGVVVLNLGDINDVDLSPIATGDLMQWDGSNWVNVSPDAVGRTTFTALDDTPASYANSHGYFVKVDETSNALTFSDTIDGGTYGGTTLANTARPTRRVASRAVAEKIKGQKDKKENKPSKKRVQTRKMPRRI